MLLPYISHFNKPLAGIVPFYDEHLLDVCEVFLYETGRLGRLKELVRHRKRIERLANEEIAED